MQLDCTRFVLKIDVSSRDEAPAQDSIWIDSFVTGSASSPTNSLKIGDIEVANRVLLAPMSGITDAPFRRLAANLGAGLVISEMTASDDLAEGKRIARRRIADQGT